MTRYVHVIVAAPVREQIVHLVKRGHIRDRRVDVSARVERGQVHVSFSEDRIWGTIPQHVPIGSVRNLANRKSRKVVGER